jgi:hypothetical protein
MEQDLYFTISNKRLLSDDGETDNIIKEDPITTGLAILAIIGNLIINILFFRIYSI